MNKYLITPIRGAGNMESALVKRDVLPDLCISAMNRDEAVDYVFGLLLPEYCPDGAETMDTEDCYIEKWAIEYNDKFEPVAYEFLDLREVIKL